MKYIYVWICRQVVQLEKLSQFANAKFVALACEYFKLLHPRYLLVYC
jgi:hypothetical protein